MKFYFPVFAVVIIILCIFVYFEPQITKGAVDSDSITVTQTVTEEISISVPGDVAMAPSIPGVTGNAGVPSTGSATWTVITNCSAGFNLALKASTDPAMQLDGSNQFTDYSTAAPSVPDYDWSSPAASAAEFGYTVEPETAADAAQIFKNNGVNTCNDAAGTQSDSHCWVDFTTLDVIAVDRGSATDSSGQDALVKFQAESNEKFLASGDYTATVTATATTN
jgi:hypothetical protein